MQELLQYRSVKRDAALTLAARFGWRILPLHTPDARGRCSCRNPDCGRYIGKHPRNRNGVTGASADPGVISRWWEMWPDANIGVATGAPGPQVLDVDNLDKAPAQLAFLASPGVMRPDNSVARALTHRGYHLYFAGSEQRTVSLPYGELRGRGGYVIAPPSVHRTGHAYQWATEPNGLLLEVPDFVVPEPTGAGRGEQPAVAARVPHGERHAYLTDFAVRLARAGITDEARVLAHVQLEFDLYCVTDPAPAPGSLEGIARWVTEKCRIAKREAASEEMRQAIERMRSARHG